MSVSRLTMYSANPDTTIAISIDNKVTGMLYPIGTGRLNASMPMKCIDQIPVPIEKAPPHSHQRAATPLDEVIRLAKSSAVYDANIATSSERRTSQWS